MDPGCLAHRLTPDERAVFESDGYLVLRGVLEADDVARLRSVADRIDAEYRLGAGITPHHVLNRHDLVGVGEPAFDALLAWTTTLPKVVDVLGWNIQLFHTQLIVTPPAPDGAGSGPYGWHQDNNRMNQDFEIAHPHPRVSVKLGYLLSDTPEPDMGNLCVVPGSHLGPFPDGADHVQLTGSAGDAVLFDRRIWHSASTNTSQVARVMAFYGYSYRWLRPKSAMQLDLDAVVDPIERQLLGWASTPNGYFDPTDDDVPLRAWWEQHVGAPA